MRVLALWSPDWPVTAAARAAHVPAERPAAVVVANRVLACSAVARASGVRRGLRRREAQARCPELAVLAPDTDRDARLFEPVVVAVEELAPGVEVVRPGLLVLPAQGPAGWFGGELAAAERLVDQVAAHAGVECQAGVADGLFAAVLAARRGLAVEAGSAPAFLASLGVEELDREPDVDRSELVGLLRRLGLRSLGAFGALTPGDVASRFGADAVLAHRLARGLDPRPPVRRCPPAELAVEQELDPPVDRVDTAAFAARGLAERLHAVLAAHGLSCTRLGVGARTVAGEEPYRVWRCAEPLTPSGTVDRVRWQLDSWLVRGGSGAVCRLRLVPEETVAAGALQLGLWGEVGEADERAGRALVRVQAMLGPDAVVTAVLGGGRDPAERVRLVPWGDDRGDARIPGPEALGPAALDPGVPELDVVPELDAVPPGPVLPLRDPVPGLVPAGWPADVLPAAGVRPPDLPVAVRRRSASARSPAREPAPPWPGRLPAPSPAVVPADPLPAELHDAAGHPVRITAPDLLTAPPHTLAVDGGPAGEVRGWAGPWPVWQRWWTPDGVAGSRLQIVRADGAAFLLLGRADRWWVTGVYD
ncbi:MAG: protein ImuB [Pseudonocardiales bacterium]|nr:protein ImuB [Pseudonocardiales bacterium]